MPAITLNNYDNNYEPTSIPVATWIRYEYENNESIIDSNGVEWTALVDEDSSSVRYRLVNYSTTYYTLSDFFDIARSLHLGTLMGFLDADIIGKYPTTERFGLGTDSLQQPYYDFNSSGPMDNSWGITFNNTRFQLRSGTAGRTDYCLSPLCVYPNEAKTTCRYGGLSIVQEGGGGVTLWVEIVFFKNINENLWGFPDADPGEPGFVPTGAHTSKHIPGIGGRGTTRKKDPDYASDTVTQPSRPNESQASAVKSGFLKAYLMTQAQLDKICSALYSDTLLDVIKSSFVNPLDFIVSLMVFPTDPDVGATENLRFGKWIASAASGVIGALGVDITGSRLTYEFKTINFGTIQIPENWGNFLDYSQTSIELYLPFIGSVNIDVAECMGGTINVQYTIDFFTGMCVANVLCERSFPLPSGKFIPNRAQHAYQGNCAIQIPLSAADYGSMVGSLINACTQGISNPAAGFAGIASDAIAGGLRPNISSKGNIVANSGFCSVLYPYVRITRPITAEPDSYQEVMGYPSYINTTLGECEDLCICDEIDLKGVTGATEEELNRIRQLCKDGVYV